MIFTKQEKIWITEMIELEKQLDILHPHSAEFANTMLKWHSYPKKLKDWRRQELGV